MQNTIFLLWFDTKSCTLLGYQNYYWHVGLKKSTQKVHCKKTPFEDGHFSNGEKKHENKIPLLFS